MSSLKVGVVLIDEILPHPNADRLEIARIAGWNCVIRKGEYHAQDKVVYIPVDSVLPFELESKLFPPDSKVKLEKSRVRTIKLRGAISQGIIATLEELGLEAFLAVGEDVADELGITKYEPPVKSTPGLLRGNMLSPKKGNSLFRKYTDIENFKYYNILFTPEDIVWVSEKLHGTSVRYALLPTETNTVWKKIKKFFHLLPKYEFCLGSRNVQLQYKLVYDGFYETNVYGKVATQEFIKTKLIPGESVYGEIVGSGIQKDYTYGCNPGEHKFFVYDVMRDGRWLNYRELKEFCNDTNLNLVPVLYEGPYDADLISSLRQGDSTIGGQKVREGVVIKTTVEKPCIIGRSVLKFLSDDYLLKEPSDFH
jgi:RNA ligase (TIGR02306 family)